LKQIEDFTEMVTSILAEIISHESWDISNKSKWVPSPGAPSALNTNVPSVFLRRGGVNQGMASEGFGV
jgi:hypothetical protein